MRGPDWPTQSPTPSCFFPLHTRTPSLASRIRTRTWTWQPHCFTSSLPNIQPRCTSAHSLSDGHRAFGSSHSPGQPRTHRRQASLGEHEAAESEPTIAFFPSLFIAWHPPARFSWNPSLGINDVSCDGRVLSNLGTRPKSTPGVGVVRQLYAAVRESALVRSVAVPDCRSEFRRHEPP